MALGRAKINTTFCLDMGIVSINTEGEGGENISERVELRSFGLALSIDTPPAR